MLKVYLSDCKTSSERGKKTVDIEQILKDKKKRKYSPKNYKPNKNCVPVIYNGTEYKSKAQCMAVEGISQKELNEYLASAKD